MTRMDARGGGPVAVPEALLQHVVHRRRQVHVELLMKTRIVMTRIIVTRIIVTRITMTRMEARMVSRTVVY